MTPLDLQSVLQAIVDAGHAPVPCTSAAPFCHFLEKLQVATFKYFYAPVTFPESQLQIALESCVLALPQRDSVLVSVAAARCIALRPLCRAAAVAAWSQRLLLALNTNPELLLLLPPAAAPGSFLTVLPEAAAACVRALVETVNAAPPFQRAELLRVRARPICAAQR